MIGTLFFNPNSGRRDLEVLDGLIRAARDGGVDPVPIVPDLDIASMVRERIDRGQRLFLAAGGDGTINHVMQGIVHTEAALGIIPIGTLNHFAKDLSIPLDPLKALETALKGETHQIDVGRVNNRYFLNNISLGLYPEIVEHREQLRQKHNRWRAYAYATYVALQKFPHVSLAIETPHRLEAIKTHVFLVSVNPYDLTGLGFSAQRTSFETGRLSVLWLEHLPKLEFIRAIGRYLRGKVDEIEGFSSLQTVQLKIQSSKSAIRVGMDGELLEMESPLLVSIDPKSLLIRLPRGSLPQVAPRSRV